MEQSDKQAPAQSPISLGLGLIEAASAATRMQPEEVVPLNLLPYFRFLNKQAQRSIMKQLIDRGQSADATVSSSTFLRSPRHADFGGPSTAPGKHGDGSETPLDKMFGSSPLAVDGKLPGHSRGMSISNTPTASESGDGLEVDAALGPILDSLSGGDGDTFDYAAILQSPRNASAPSESGSDGSVRAVAAAYKAIADAAIYPSSRGQTPTGRMHAMDQDGLDLNQDGAEDFNFSLDAGLDDSEQSLGDADGRFPAFSETDPMLEDVLFDQT